MNIAITTAAADMDGPIDARFGRAARLMLVDTETGKFTVHDNENNLNAAQGAGIQTAEAVVRLGAGAVITGNVGPKAFRVLRAAGIDVYLCRPASVAEAVCMFKAGELTSTDGANVAAHWS